MKLENSPDERTASRDCQPSALSNLAMELAQTCPNTFNELVVSNQDDPTKRIVQATFQEQAQYVLTTYRYVIIEWPREHGKTEQIIGRIVFELGRAPWLRIVIVCANNIEAKKRIAAIGQYIQSYRVQRIFPWLMPAQKGEWSTNALFVQRFTQEAVVAISAGDITAKEAYRGGYMVISKDPSVEARGILGAGTGSRGDLVVYDDPCDFANTIGRPAMRSLVISAYTDNWEQVVTKVGGRQWYLGTPWAEDDLLAYMKSIAVEVDSPRDKEEPPEEWRHFRRATGRGQKYGEIEPLWPERIGIVQLNAALRKIGPTSYARAYQLKAVSDEDRMFSERALNAIQPIALESLHRKVDGTVSLPCFGGIDLAISTSDKADNRVITTIYLRPNAQRILVNQSVGKWDGTMTADVAIADYQKYAWNELKVENNAMQELFMVLLKIRVEQRIANKTLEEGLFINTQPFTTTALNKWDEAIGLPSIAAEMEAGMWQVVLPADHTGGKVCNCWFCNMLAELRGFRNNGTSAAPHDDRVMSLLFVRECVRAYGTAPEILGEDSRKIPPRSQEVSIMEATKNW